MLFWNTAFLFENVQIIKREHIWDKSPEYVKSIPKDEMKTATLINVTQDPSGGDLTERPNFLSSVIRSHPTSVSTPLHVYKTEEGSPTYDLDSISRII